jgi:CRISPR/Cas system CSM-associated protein Csm3 (group 7 of RAMP superfamily)
MARSIHRQLLVEGTLLALGPLHVGGAGEGDTSDMPVAVDGLGRPYLPGTALAGAIRHWEQMQPVGDAFWGDSAREDAGAARLSVDDAPAADAPALELWHGVGIDRKHGGAFRGIKYDREVLPAGTTFSLRLQAEVPDAAALAGYRARLARIVQALQAGEIAIGAASTRGLGRVRLVSFRACELDLASRAGLLAHLRGTAAADPWPAWQKALQQELQQAESSLARTPGRVSIRIGWRPTGALMSKAAWDGIATDIMPFVSRVGADAWALALPGSSIKGALRQHAERIVRTVLGADFAIDDAQHHGQVDVPLVRELFGHTKRSAEAGGGGARGLLAVASCYATARFGGAELAALDHGQGERPRGLDRADHVAIDRWTGGAAEALLYNAIEPRGIDWQPLELTLDLRRLQAADADTRCALLALLMLLLDDLVRGQIALGYGVNRGYGAIDIVDIHIRGLAHAAAGLPDDIHVKRPLADVPHLRAALEGGWSRWVARQQREGAFA